MSWFNLSRADFDALVDSAYSNGYVSPGAFLRPPPPPPPSLPPPPPPTPSLPPLSSASAAAEVPWSQLEPLCVPKGVIGTGGTATCYRGKLRGESVVIKCIATVKGGKAKVAVDAAFRRELDVLTRLSVAPGSPYLVRLLGFCTLGESDAGLPTRALVMEDLAGGSLKERLDADAPPTETQLLAWAVDVAEGLRYLHKDMTAHLDVKPHNVLLRAEPPAGATPARTRAVLADFGLSKTSVTISSYGGNSSAMVGGSSAYMSPEQWDPDGRVGLESDIWSLGCLLCEIGGKAPWFGLSQPQILTKLAAQAATPELPDSPALRRVAEMCLQLDKGRRPTIAQVPVGGEQRAFNTCTAR